MKKQWRISGFADEISDSLEEQINGLHRLNMSWVEMRGVDGRNLIDHSDEKVSEIKKRLDDAGISLSACGSPLGKIDIGDPFEPHLERLKRAIDVAHKMGTDNIRIFSFFVPAKERPARKAEVLDRMGRMVRCAEENGAVLLHENEKEIYGEMAPECLELMKAFYGDHFKAVFDFANFVQAGQETLDAYRMKGTGYYSFDRGGFRFVVADANYFRLGPGKFVHYGKGGHAFIKGRHGYSVPPEQLASSSM